MEDAARFYSSLKDASSLSSAGRIDAFVYHLTEQQGAPSAGVKDVEQCFRDCHLAVPGSVAAHLSKGVKSKPPKFIKVAGGGYRLERHAKEGVQARLGAETTVVDIPRDFRKLLDELPDGARKDFLREALDCFGVHAYRAAIVMVWLLTLDHLFELILKSHSTAFNAVLAANTDKRIKITSVSIRDDFGEIPESKFIEFCRSAGIITNDVRKILDQKLGTRNSAAHPSGVVFSRAKVVDFIEDLIENVIKKYPVLS